MKNADKPINPTILREVARDMFKLPIPNERIERQFVESSCIGLTKREYAAIKILSGLCVMAIPGNHNTPDEQVRELIPQAIRLADELLKQLEK